jgi:hypothetical protein
METNGRKEEPQLTFEERRLRLEEQKIALESSFARKWLPTLATLMVGLIAGMFSFVQQQNSIEATKRARDASAEETRRAEIDAKAKSERDYGFKVIEIYLDKRELFDLTKNPATAELNLRALAAVAPDAVKGVLEAEKSKIPPPSQFDGSKQVGDAERTDSLAAVAGVQDALAAAEQQSARSPEAGFRPSDFTVYVQYAAEDRAVAVKAQNMLAGLGYHVPGIDEVEKVPSRLQVRYYRTDQKSQAGDLASDLGKALGLPAGTDNAILVTSKKKLPAGILEVWLPRQAG